MKKAMLVLAMVFVAGCSGSRFYQYRPDTTKADTFSETLDCQTRYPWSTKLFQKCMDEKGFILQPGGIPYVVGPAF